MATLGYPFLAAWLTGLRKESRITELERQLEALKERVQRLSSARLVEQAPHHADAPVKEPSPAIAKPSPIAAVDDSPAPLPPPPEAIVREPLSPRPIMAGDEDRVRRPAPPAPDPVPDPERPTPRWVSAARTWLLTGNLVAKLGLVILFIGIGFLLKYAAATITIPIEPRLAAVVFADIGLLAWGWRIRLTRRQIALSIQGTAIAILILVIIGAYQLYALVSASFAFALLVCLTAFACVLAVLQEASWLAAFGITGGFASPVLLSSGEGGSHIALFSYYALINAGVFVLAFMRSWHPLNLLGFVFTFIIGAV